MVASVGADVSQSQAQPVAASASGSQAAHDGFNFHDILEVINPLQHLPVISTIYRELSGDTISPAARVAGDALYGGIWGLGSSIINELVEGETGKDIGGHIWATLFGDDDGSSTTAAASASPAPGTASTAPANAAASGTVTPVAATTPTGAATPPATAPAPAPPTGPTSYFQKLQTSSHVSHGVPLNATVPIGTTHAPVALGRSPGGPPLVSGGTAAAPAIAPANTASPSAAPVTAPASPTPALATPAPVAVPVVPPANVADLMSKALDKYKALAQQQDAAGVPAAALIN